ncbi:MAG: methyltransferase domain-containing protein [Bacteroidota bacterium]
MQPASFWRFLSIILLFSGCKAQDSSSSRVSDTQDSSPIYIQRKPNAAGIGKYYMGREISHVMGHLGASWLERPEREAEEQTSLLVENLELGPTDVVADIGAGTGYFSFRMAKLVPEGKVLAVDIQQEMLDIIQVRKQEEGVENIELILGEETSPKLPRNTVDLVLYVDVYHELSYPREMMENIYQALKPGGRVILVEYRLEDPQVPIKRLHKMSLEQGIKEMEAVGLGFVENRDMLPWQHFMIFEKAE